MGRIKIRQRVHGDNICLKQISKYTVDDCKQEESTFLWVDSGDDSDDSELAEAGSEFGMVGDQLSSIPYELYDLPDLKEILSLETWNSCLTEAERFSLSAYLPDMDQHTFWLTMTELLSGKGMFFGSPLTQLFERLKGGFYPPKVTRFREGLQFLHKRAFYHSLRSYHESMIWTFSEMKRAWSKCQPSFSVEERMHFWSMWKNHKHPKGRVDSNAFAVDDDLLRKGSTKVITGHVAKKMKFPPVKNIPLASLRRTNGKGVLKIKPSGMNTIQTSVVCRAPPKGVLKIVPRGPLGQLQQARAMTRRQEPATLPDDASCLQTCRSSPLPQSSMCRWDAENYFEEFSFLHQTIRDRKAHKNPKLPKCTTIVRQQMEYLTSTTTGLSENIQNSARKIQRAKDPTVDAVTDVLEGNLSSKNSQNVRRYTHESIGIGETLTSGNLWHNPGKQKIDYHRDSGEQKMASMHAKLISMCPRTTEAVSRISGSSTGGRGSFAATSMDQSNERDRDINDGGLEKAYGRSLSVPQGLRGGVVLPITYKRRKSYTKVDRGLDFVKLPSAGASFEARTLEEGENAKAMKIKFKNWKDHKPLQEKGILNGLRHGSPYA